jgi:hypothetical protein
VELKFMLRLRSVRFPAAEEIEIAKDGQDGMFLHDGSAGAAHPVCGDYPAEADREFRAAGCIGAQPTITGLQQHGFNKVNN